MEKKSVVIQEVKKKNGIKYYIFSKNLNKYFYTEATEKKLQDVYKTVIKDKDSLYCEYILPENPVNIKLDIDTYDDPDKITSIILNKIKLGLRYNGCAFNSETDVYQYKSPNKMEDGKIKYSRHIVIRGRDWCFASRKDIKIFMMVHKIPHVDMSVYGDTLFRVPYSSKEGQNRPALPMDHVELSDYEHFKLGLMGYIQETQLKKIIKLSDSIDNIKKSAKIQINTTIDTPITKLIEEIFNFKIVKVYNNKAACYFYYNKICVLCKKTHTRDDSQYIIIKSSTTNLIEIVFKCWTNNKFIKYHIPRLYISKIYCNINDPPFNLESCIKKILLLSQKFGFNQILDLKMDIQQNITKGNIINIDQMHLDPMLFISEYENNFVGSVEGSGKTYGYVKSIKMILVAEKCDYSLNAFMEYFPNLDEEYDYMEKLKCYRGKKFIITSPNISTLSNIKRELIENDIKFTWYNDKNIDKNDIHNGKFKILLITINSLPMLLDEFYEAIDNPKQYILWNDETSHTYNYVNSDTLNGCRFKAYHAFELLTKYCYKKFFTCADLTDEVIDIMNRSIGGKSVIFVNKHINQNIASRTYNIIDNILQYKNIIKKCIIDKKKICILTDSKKYSKLYFEYASEIIDNIKKDLDPDYLNNLAEKKKNIQESRKQGKHRCIFEELYSEIFIVNSEINNECSVLENINEIIIGKQILIASPSLGIGLSLHIEYFDELFGIFTGKSITCEEAGQMLNRVRELKEDNHYLHFVNPKRKYLVTDYELMQKIYKYVAKKQKNIINEFNMQKSIIYHDDTFEVKIQGFLPEIYIWSQMQTNRSFNDFKTGVIKCIIKRGAKVNLITDINIDNIVETNNTKSIDFGVIKDMDYVRLIDIVSVPLITNDEAKLLSNKQYNKVLTTLEKQQLIKYRFYNTYDIIESAQEKCVLNFLKYDAREQKLWNILDNWFRYMLSSFILIDQEEIYIKDGVASQIHLLFMKYLKKLGFNNYLISSNKVAFDTTFIIENSDMILFKTLLGKAMPEYRGSQKKSMFPLFNKLLNNFYGAKIVKKRKTVRGKPKLPKGELHNVEEMTSPTNTVSNNFSHDYYIQIEISDVVRDYIVLKYSRKYINQLEFNGVFSFSHIHGHIGNYYDFQYMTNTATTYCNKKPFITVVNREPF